MTDVYRKEWPVGSTPHPSTYNHFIRAFVEIRGFNWLLLPSVTKEGVPKYRSTFYDGTATMKFIYSGKYTAHHSPNTFVRRSVLIQKEDTLLHLYVDEDARLFAKQTSEVSVGQLNIVDNIWNGTANLDLDYILKEFPLAIWNRNPWD